MRLRTLSEQLARKSPSWLVLGQILLVMYCLVPTAVRYFGYYLDWYPEQKWDSLPPLPDGETAKEITEIYVHREIHVVTDKGHFYGCTYLNERQCWFPIPREINHYTSRLPWNFGDWTPEAPPGARQLVVERFHRHDDAGDISFAAIILANGQVAFWDNNQRLSIPLSLEGLCLGLLLVFFGVGVLEWLKRWIRRNGSQ